MGWPSKLTDRELKRDSLLMISLLKKVAQVPLFVQCLWMGFSALCNGSSKVSLHEPIRNPR